MTARRRKKEEPLLEVLFTAPWWIPIVIGVLVFVAMRWIAPAILGSSLILKPITAALSSVAWVFSSVLFAVGVMSFVRQKMATSKAESSQKTSATWNPRVIDGGRSEAKPGFPEIDQPIPSQWSPAPTINTPPTEWTIDLLRDLEWKRFEDVCQKFYETKGIKSETTPLGPDGGIDIRLYQDDTGKASAIVQCKAWGDKDVGVKPVRELLGVMAHEKITKAFFMAAGGFTDDAKTFAAGNKITLVTGDMLVSMIKRLPDADKQALLMFATEGDYHTPTCPSCGIKMRHVPGSGGRQEFWGCQNYPRCRQKLGMRAADRT